MDDYRDAVMPTFLGESEENLEGLEQALLNLDRAPNRDEAIGAMFRLAHTLKGNTESLGIEAMSQCAHALESVLDAVRRQAVAVTPALVTVLLGGRDALRSMLSTVAAGGIPELGAYEEVMHALAETASGHIIPASPESGAPLPAVAGGHDPRARKSLRVGLATLDQIVTHTGELSIALARLGGIITRHGDGRDALLEVERLFEALREQAMRLRLVPIGPMLRQQLRGVRDLAAAHGKLARLVVEGDDVEVDASVLDGLRDPVTHMVRNAVDHALEEPERRRATGKDPIGTITLRARYEAGWVVVEVSDDGAGFDRGRIRERALAMGLLQAGARVDDDDLLRFVLAPGFSTARAVTDLSGRGVGMDVVARNVAALKGSVGLRSPEGGGATVTLRVPLTLAVIDGFAVGAAGETYVIPMDAVRECVGLPRGQGSDDADSILNLRGEPLPCVRLGAVLGVPHMAVMGNRSVVVVEQDGRRAGLVVDALVGETQAVVKPIGGGLAHVRRVSGSTILGSGRVALILDVPEILREAVHGGVS
jgi:two-component system chemotaxis sensor kinase CheA